MRESSETRRRWLNRLGAAILCGGLAASAWLLQHADQGGEVAEPQVIEGKVIVAAPGQAPIRRADLERVDGAASILADEFSRWLGELWQGESLAVIVAVLSVLGGLGCLLAAQRQGRQSS